jgi:xeroderma pigmentosum group C-complementing protein
MKDAEEESSAFDAPAPKRGRPFGSTNKSTKSGASARASTKAKTPAIRQPAQQKAPASRRIGKRKIQIQASEDEESPLSELESEFSELESEIKEVPMKSTKRRAKGRRATTLPAESTESLRKAPRRNAPRKSETALRSHYFKHTDDEGDDE